MNINSYPFICHKSVVKSIFGGGKKQVVSEVDPNIEKRQKEQDAREKDLKKQESSRKKAIAAGQRGSRLLLFGNERGVTGQNSLGNNSNV